MVLVLLPVFPGRTAAEKLSPSQQLFRLFLKPNVEVTTARHTFNHFCEEAFQNVFFFLKPGHFDNCQYFVA